MTFKDRAKLWKQNEGYPKHRFTSRQPCIDAVTQDPTICNGSQEQKPAPASAPSLAPKPAPAHSQHAHRPYGQDPFDNRLYDIFPESAAPSFSGYLGRNPSKLVFSDDDN